MGVEALLRRLLKEAGGKACLELETHGRIVISGMGFMCDSYDLFVISIALDMMAQNDYGVVLTDELRINVSLMAIVGAMVGQVFFGFVADQVGRKLTFLITCTCIILGTVLSASSTASSSGFHIYHQMMLWRFLLGFGVGGEYPISSTITAESSDGKHRDRHLALLFSMQGLGKLLCALVLLCCVHIKDTNAQWRVAILMGSLPMVVASYYRWRMHETEAFSELSRKMAASPEYANQTLRERFYNAVVAVKDHKRALAGTAGAWFILDVLFYGNSLFSPEITRAMGIEHDLRGKAALNAVIQLIAMPGYVCSVLFLPKIGKKRLQLVGFAAMGAIFFVMACAQPSLRQGGGSSWLLLLYSLSFFFSDFGPNTTTFIIPALIFPTEARATCHGLSAAAGKLGAILGAAIFLRIQHSGCPHDHCYSASPASQVNSGLIAVFSLCCVLAAAGFAWTWFLVEDHTHSSLLKADRSTSPRGAIKSAPGSPHFTAGCYVDQEAVEEEDIWSADPTEVEITPK